MTIPQIQTLLNANQFDEALRMLDAALIIEPENGYLWNRRGNTILLLDHKDGPPLSEAERSYLKALEINPKDLDALEELAHFYDAVIDQPDRAKKYASDYLRLTHKVREDMEKIMRGEV